MVVDSLSYQWTRLPAASILAAGSKIRVLGRRSNRAVYFARFTNAPAGATVAKSYVSNTEVPFVKIDDSNYGFTPWGDRKWSFDRLCARPLGRPDGFGHIYYDSSGDGPERPVGWEWALVVTRNQEVRVFARHPFGASVSGVDFGSVDLRSVKGTVQRFAKTGRHLVNDHEIKNEVEVRCALATATPWDTLEAGDPLYLNDIAASDYHLAGRLDFGAPDLDLANLVVRAGPELQYGIEQLSGEENWYHATNDPRGAQFNIEGDEGPDS